MRGFVLAACLIFGSVLRAQESASKTNQQPATCVVSGRVLTVGESVPVKSAQVVLIKEGPAPVSRTFSTTSDAEGRFEIKNISAGQYTFFAFHAGYLTQQYEARGMNGGAALTLVPAQKVEQVMFRMMRAAAITGRIVDESGEPFARVSVMALRKENADQIEDELQPRKEHLTLSSSALTDDRGEFRIFGLHPGEYYVRAALSGDAFLDEEDGLSWIAQTEGNTKQAPVLYPGVAQVEQAQSVVLAAGEEFRVEFAMRPVNAVEISGHVIAADGRPAVHAVVLLYPPEISNGISELTASTGAKGEFTIAGVPSGSYILSAQKHDQDNPQFVAQKLEVGSDDVDSLFLVFGQGATLRGHVAVPGVKIPDGIQIQLEPTKGSEIPNFASAHSKPDGSFQMTGVPEGDYALRIFGLDQGWYVKSAHRGAQDILHNGLRIEKGATVEPLEIVISLFGAQLQGTVTDHNKPAGGALVRVGPEPEAPYERMRSRAARTDQNGHFIFKTLPPGMYRVIATLSSDNPKAPSTVSSPEVITLEEHGHQSVELILADPGNE